MKKYKPFIIAVVCVVAIIALIVVSTKISGKKPFRDLVVTDIVSVTVHLSPPDKTIAIPEFEELVSYLKDVVIYSEDSSYLEYAGQGVTFNIITTDGTQTDVMVCNPFLVINGVGYKTKYEPCEALSSYANQLLQSCPTANDDVNFNDDNPIKKITGEEITEDGVDEELLLRKIDTEVLTQVATELQTLVEEALAEERDNPLILSGQLQMNLWRNLINRF